MPACGGCATRDARQMLRPRRSCCKAFGRTHVLLPGVMLARRADAVEVIGEALLAADGEGHRPIAARLGRSAPTVRGWLRRLRARAEQTYQHAVRWMSRSTTPHSALRPTVTPHRCRRRWAPSLGRPPQPSGTSARRRGPGGSWSRCCARDGCWPTPAAPYPLPGWAERSCRAFRDPSGHRGAPRQPVGHLCGASTRRRAAPAQRDPASDRHARYAATVTHSDPKLWPPICTGAHEASHDARSSETSSSISLMRAS